MLGLIILLATALALVLSVLTAIVVRDLRRPPRRTAAFAVARGLPCDPGELDLKFEAWHLTLPDGAILPVWEVTNREAHNPLTAVFVHGWGESRLHMLSPHSEWRDDVDRLVFYDLRGHGEASEHSSQLGRHEERDLLALIERLGEGRYLFITRGIGAAIAMAALLEDDSLRQRTHALLTIDPPKDPRQLVESHLIRQSLPIKPLADFALLTLRWLGSEPIAFTQPPRGFPVPVEVVTPDNLEKFAARLTTDSCTSDDGQTEISHFTARICPQRG
ncbi:MAG TPA: alpha/beta hydrolase [Phycisphaerales bacterium]|nr:alpha/beta hydrolase [Phycisphaerales bacterium]